MSAIKGYDRCILWLVITFFAASFLQIAYHDYSNYTMLICVLLVFWLSGVQNNMKVRFHADAYHLYTAFFVGYCALTMLWARDAALAFETVKRLFLTVAFMYLLYAYYQRKPIDYLLRAAMLGGYAACFVVVWQQGLDVYINNIINGIRVYDQDYINANVAGAMAVHAILLNLYYILYKKELKWWIAFSVPALICIAGAGSKRSLLLLVGGSMMLALFHSYDRKKRMKSMLKIGSVILLFLGIIYILRDLPMFSMITERIDQFIGSITGTGSMDVSTKERLAFLQVGVYLFKKSPLVGCGIDNARLFNWVRETYLHSNMMELLASSGLIGFGLYYSIYAYLFKNFWKYRKIKNLEYDIILVILIFYFVFDVSDMSYDQIDTYFYFMICFLEVRQLKRLAYSRKAGWSRLKAGEVQ